MELNSNLQSVRHMDSLGLDIRRATAFLNKASQLHLEAAQQQQEGNLEEAVEHIQEAQDLLLHVCEMQQSAWLNLEAAKQHGGEIVEVTENDTVQILLHQYTEIRQYNKERY